MIRADKTTPNADATRTLIFGVVVAICIIVGLDPAEATLRGEPGKAIPLFAVCGGVGVEVHLLK